MCTLLAIADVQNSCACYRHIICLKCVVGYVRKVCWLFRTCYHTFYVSCFKTLYHVYAIIFASKCTVKYMLLVPSEHIIMYVLLPAVAEHIIILTVVGASVLVAALLLVGLVCWCKRRRTSIAYTNIYAD